MTVAERARMLLSIRACSAEFWGPGQRGWRGRLRLVPDWPGLKAPAPGGRVVHTRSCHHRLLLYARRSCQRHSGRGGQDGEARSGRALHACAYGECPGTLLHHAVHPKEDGAWAGVPSGAPDSSEDGTRSRQCLHLTVTGAHRSPQTSAGPRDTCTAPATCSGISKTAQPGVPSMTQWSFLGPAVSQSVTRGLTAVDLGA